MNIFDAVILGTLEGITEFLPISSTGHLVLMDKFLGSSDELSKTFDIFIQLGAILAVVVIYFHRFSAILKKPFVKKGIGLGQLFAGCLPVFVLGFLLHKVIKEVLMTPTVVAAALIVGGAVLILIKDEKRHATLRSVDSITIKDAFVIGLFQSLSLIPGMSRSGATIVGGILNGSDRRTAAEFSFVLAVPTMCAAVAYDLLKSGSAITSADLYPFLVGFTVSFFVAILAIRLFLVLLQNTSLAVFGWYRILLGALVLWLL